MPSVYHSCTIDDSAADALNALKQYLENDVRQTFNQQLADLATAFADLEGEPTAASVTLGATTDSQIKWTAQEAGRAGNLINISYVYLGPLVDTTVSPATVSLRLPSAEVNGNTITLYLAVAADGSLGAWAQLNLFFWLANTDVTDLVQGELVGAGTDPSEPTPTTHLSGGKNRSITLVESAANQVAEPFGQKDYRELLRGLDIPVIESAADAAQYIQDGGDYVVVGHKLLIVDGTNLVAINKIYEKTGNDLDLTREILAGMAVGLPTMLTTQNVTARTYEFICGALQPIDTVVETYRNVNTNIKTTVAINGGDLESLHHYVFWPEVVRTSQTAYNRLVQWGIPEDYIGDVLSGETATQEEYLEEQAPEVYLAESLTLLDDLLFTDAELEELLAMQISGVRIPHKVPMAERVRAISKVLARRPSVGDNGMRNKIKAPIAGMQAMDVAKTTDDQNLAKELSARGKACARSADRLDPSETNSFAIPNLPDMDLPNLSFDQLPDPAKKIESAYGALSGGISFANRIFDLMVGSLTSMVERILNKVQNVASLTDNLFGNSLAQCLLGTGSALTGSPEYTGIGAGGGNSIPQIGNILGGLPLPAALLKEAFKKLSIDLDETITDAFEAMMKTLQIPLCIIQKLLGSLGGFDLGSLLNPCKDGGKPDESCPPEAVQAVIDASDTLTSALSTIPSLEDMPTTLPTFGVEETVQNFTGSVQKTVTETTDTVTRGLQEVMDEISQSVDAKIEMVEQFDKAIKELFGDARDLKETIDEDAAVNSGCFPSPLGLFTDEIADFI